VQDTKAEGISIALSNLPQNCERAENSSSACSCASWRTPSAPASYSSSASSPHLAEPQAFDRRLGELRHLDWVVYAKPHRSAGPSQVLAYLGRYTHRVTIANRRLLSLTDSKVPFTWKDYRTGGKTKVMTVVDAHTLARVRRKQVGLVRFAFSAL
jgi:hypothetical protein